MAILLKTVEGADIETGFWGPDTSKVQLGELPPITTPQFAEYSGSVLPVVIPTLDTEVRQRFAREVHAARSCVAALPVLNITGKFITLETNDLMAQMDAATDAQRGELLAMLSAAAVPTDGATYYRKNPFNAQPDSHTVKIQGEDATKHTITSEDFMHLVVAIMSGGMAGWSQYGTYPEIKALAVHFDKLLSEGDE